MRLEGPQALPPPREEYREGEDYTLDVEGRWVFTAEHLKSRGYCCFQACRNCPWGQAGRSTKEVFDDLQSRLDRLESRLQAGGIAVEITGYRLGTLHARPPDRTCATDLPGLARRVKQEATDILTVADVAWG